LNSRFHLELNARLSRPSSAAPRLQEEIEMRGILRLPLREFPLWLVSGHSDQSTAEDGCRAAILVSASPYQRKLFGKLVAHHIAQVARTSCKLVLVDACCHASKLMKSQAKGARIYWAILDTKPCHEHFSAKAHYRHLRLLFGR
jgi:hypothetical protein